MSRLAFASVVLAACASSAPSAPVLPAQESIVPVEKLPEPAIAAPDRFPAGRGVVLLHDDLSAAWNEMIRTSVDHRLAIARARLGERNEELDDAMVWYGAGARGVAGPYDCWELALVELTTPTLFRTDRRHCGLPYRDDASKPWVGAGPRFTKRRLEAVVAEIGTKSPDEAAIVARQELNLPDVQGVVEKLGTNERQWSAVGGRDDEAPITCWVLSISSRVRLEQRELAACGIAWPPAADAFERGEDVPPVKLSNAGAACNDTCSPSDVCVTTRVTHGGATAVTRGDDLLAYGYDGRPARIEVRTSCVPVPTTCSTINVSCFFKPFTPGTPRDTGPCGVTSDEFTGYGSTRTPSGRFMITCAARKK